MNPDQSYQKQASEWDAPRSNDSTSLADDLWFRTETCDYWRHARMYEAAGAFTHRTDWKWLTVGDGRYGLDSIRLRKFGVVSVMPTDIGGGLLDVALKNGLIKEYKVENAEKLSFDDNSYDISFCKESYHHFPRPAIALYEMLRVSKQAVILVEPRDYTIDRPASKVIGPLGLFSQFKHWLSVRLKLKGKVSIEERYHLGDLPHYETSGNYMYTISSREMEKVALGLDLPTIAIKGLNDCFLPEGGTALATEGSAVFAQMKTAIQNADHLSNIGITSTSMIMVILFKEAPDSTMRAFLKQHDWLVKDLPRNPYIN